MPLLTRRDLVRGAWTLAVILFICIASYFTALSNGFTLDDEVIIVRNEHIRSLSAMPRLFTMNWWNMAPASAAGNVYRPLAAASYTLDVVLGGNRATDSMSVASPGKRPDARFMHVTSVAYHFLASAVLYCFLLTLLPSGSGIFAAGVGAAIFACHPVHVEAVASLVGRAEVLTGLFCFAAATVWVHGRDRTLWTIASAMLWFLGLLSKEMAITLPALLVMVDIVRNRRRTLIGWVRCYAPYVFFLALYVAMRHVALRGTQVESYLAMPPSRVSYLERVMTMAHAFATYLRLAVLPVDLSSDYGGFPITRTLLSPVFLASLALHVMLIGASAFAMARHRRWPHAAMAAMGVLGFYLTLSPVSNLFLNTGVIVSERAMYVPVFGVSLAVAACFHWLVSREESGAVVARVGPARAAATVIAVGLVASGIMLTGQASRVWASNETLFRAAVEHPYCGSVGFGGMGHALQKAGRTQEALSYLERSIEARPNRINLYHKAQCLISLNRHADAIPALQTLIANEPNNQSSVSMLVTCYLRAGRRDDALKLLGQYPKLTAPGGPLRTLFDEASRPAAK